MEFDIGGRGPVERIVLVPGRGVEDVSRVAEKRTETGTKRGAVKRRRANVYQTARDMESTPVDQWKGPIGHGGLHTKMPCDQNCVNGGQMALWGEQRARERLVEKTTVLWLLTHPDREENSGAGDRTGTEPANSLEKIPVEVRDFLRRGKNVQPLDTHGEKGAPCSSPCRTYGGWGKGRGGAT